MRYVICRLQYQSKSKSFTRYPSVLNYYPLNIIFIFDKFAAVVWLRGQLLNMNVIPNIYRDFCEIENCPYREIHERKFSNHAPGRCSDVIMSEMASQITSLMIGYSTVYSGTDQRKHQSSASLNILRGIKRWPVNSPHKGPVTWNIFPFDDVIMCCHNFRSCKNCRHMTQKITIGYTQGCISKKKIKMVQCTIEMLNIIHLKYI